MYGIGRWSFVAIAATMIGVFLASAGSAVALVPTERTAVVSGVAEADGGAGVLAATSQDVARRALVVEGEYDAVRVADHADLEPREAITIEAWVKQLQPRGCGTLVGKDRAVSYWFGLCDGRLRFYTSFGAYADGNAVVPEGRWSHVAVTYDGTTIRFYVGGSLDRQSTSPGGPLEDAAADLRIGADEEPGLALHGTIDHVRLWSVVRSEDELRANAFETLSAQSGLAAQWPLDGNARDLAGGHDGRIASGGRFTYDGAVPRDIAVPLSAQAPSIDGRCDALEYGAGQRVAVDVVDAPTVWIQATRSDVFVCFDRMRRPRTQNGLAYVYLDRDLSRDAAANDRDYRLGINQRGIMEADTGDGVGAWRDLVLPAGVWQAAQVQDTDVWSAEVRFPRSFLDRPSESDDPIRFGLAVAHTAEVPALAEYAWPVMAAQGSPATWSTATLSQSEGLLPPARFSGAVVRHTNDAAREGLAGAVVRLLAVDGATVRVVDRYVTGRGGGYELEYWGAAPEAFVVQELDPRGVTSVSADAGPAAGVVSVNLLRYEVGDDGQPVGSAAPGTFVDEVADVGRSPLRSHYLIVYAAPVRESDLWPIVAERERQGFMVEAVRTDELSRLADGRDLAEKIHNWLKGHWQAADKQGERVYALLIGRGDKVPFRDVGWMDNDHRTPGQPDYFPAWPTDWYYADLDSEWDADGDGYFGEFMRCPPGETYDGPDGVIECPEEGSLMREGPFGALRSPDDDFQPEISVGRIALNEPGEVRRALQAVAAAENTLGTEKRKALVEGSFWTFEGSSWDRASGQSVRGGDARSDAWVGLPWNGRQPLGTDTADHLDVTLTPILERTMADVQRFYEATVPYDIPEYLAPTMRNPNAPLTPLASEDEWQTGRRALVNVAGRGGSMGIAGARWAYDWNNDFKIDQPADPRTCRDMPVGPGQSGPPCWELLVEPFVHGLMPQPDGVPPVVIANASDTGAVAWSVGGLDENGNVLDLSYGPVALAGQLPSRGLAAAWVGAVGDVQPAMLDAFQDEANRHLLESPFRVGDAVWAANSSLVRGNPYDMRVYGVGLFGDPAMAYWGNPVDALGPWPQDGGDLRATGASAASGPAVPDVAWRSSEQRPASSPSMGRDGTLVVVSQSGVVRVAPDGRIVGQTTLTGVAGPMQYPPALAVDGAYVAAGSTLYVMDATLGAREQVRLPAGASVTGAPRIAPDGAVWVPASSGMVRVAGSGRAERVDNEPALGPMVVLPDGGIAWPIDGGAIATYEVDRAGEAVMDVIDVPTFGTITAAAANSEGRLFVGSTDGRLYAVAADGASWQLDLGGAIRARPLVGADGTVYAASENGVVVSVAPGGAENWRRELSGAIRAGLALDGSQLYVALGDELLALELSSGADMWRADLGAQAGGQSTPVIGGDRTVYVTRGDQTLVAVREAGWLAAPTDVRITTETDQASVEWADNATEEAGYVVELCGTDGRCTKVGEVGPDTTRIVARRLPYAPGEPLFARVRADGFAGAPPEEANASLLAFGNASLLAPDTNHASEYARSGWAISLPPAPEPVAHLEAQAAGAESIGLSWTYGADAAELAGFEIRRSTDAFGPFNAVAMASAGARDYVDRELEPKTEYHYQVLAVNDSGTARPVATHATTLLRNLAAPGDVTARYQSGAFVLHWRDATAGESGFIVERRGPGEAWFQVVGVLAADVEWFRDTLYVEGGRYHYRVKAVGEKSESEYAGIAVRTTGRDLSDVYMPIVVR